MTFDFRDCPHCGTEGVLPMTNGACPHCKKTLGSAQASGSDIREDGPAPVDSLRSQSAACPAAQPRKPVQAPALHHQGRPDRRDSAKSPHAEMPAAPREIEKRQQNGAPLSADLASPLEDGADGWHDICIGPGQQTKVPDLCPNCSQPATKTVKVRADAFQQSSTTEMLVYGWFGHLFRTAVMGSASEARLEVKICHHCWQHATFFKVLDWVCRLSGVGALVILAHFLSTPAKPLIDRGFGLVLLVVVVPLAVGLASGYAFRRLAHRRQGVIFRRSDDQGDWFQVRSRRWLDRFLEMRPNAATQACDGRPGTQGKSAFSISEDYGTAFLVRTYHAWKEGRFAHLRVGAEQKRSAESAGLNKTVGDIEKEHSKLIEAAFQTRPFSSNEWLAAALNTEFLLTNECLYLFLDRKIPGRIETLILQDVAEYSAKGFVKVTLHAVMKDGRKLTYGPLGACPAVEYVNALKAGEREAS